jgi:ribonuclease III
MNNTKFKANPYNSNNKLISENDVIDIMKSVNINDFTPTNLHLYQTSFIHKSYNKLSDYEEFSNTTNCLELQDLSYETLEFLGDSLLGCITAEYLYKRYEGEDEGFFTKIKTRIVNGEQLSNLANKLNMNQFLVISKHIEDNCNGRNNQHILEDVLEAFIGAIYLDTDSFIKVKEFVVNLIETYLDLPEIILRDTNFKDQILRYFQHNYKVYPTYKHINNDNNNEFICELYKENDIICTGKGISKKKAEQNASYNALLKFNVL